MFNDLKQEDILDAIKSLRGEELRKTQYKVQFRGELFPPKEIIRRAYELKNKPVPYPEFTTDPAQSRLLKLGFPIVDSNQLDFFSEKELDSFTQLVQRKSYDSKNKVDSNIGAFINNVIWEKSKKWRDKLVEIGWKTDRGNKNWTTLDKKHGQRYKKYTWYRLFPDNPRSKLIFFTVGVDDEGSLVYKIDIQRNDPFFTKARQEQFDNLKKKYKRPWRKVIPKEQIDRYNWNKLVKETNTFLKSWEDYMMDISYSIWPERRLMRLIWNTNKWHRPSGQKWSINHQGKKDRTYSAQHGFGAEEWLFSPRFRIDGYQFGYVRGIYEMPGNVDRINELFLYSKNPSTRENLLVAKLFDVEIIWSEDDLYDDEIRLFEKERSNMALDIKAIGGDDKEIKKKSFVPNLRFPWDLAEIYDEPVVLSDKVVTTNHFVGIKINDKALAELEEIADEEIRPSVKFNEGNNSGKNNKHTRQSKGGKIDVNKTHVDITNDLFSYLKKAKDYKGYSIATENMTIGTKLVDTAAKKGNDYVLFEVKTMSTVKPNIRQGLGQVLEYALSSSDINVKRIIIVGPALPNKTDISFLSKLKKTIKIPLEYWSYSFGVKKLSERFKIY